MTHFVAHKGIMYAMLYYAYMTLLTALGHLALVILTGISGILHDGVRLTERIDSFNSSLTSPIAREVSNISDFLAALDDIVTSRLRTDVRYQQAATLGSTNISLPNTPTPVSDALVNIYCSTRIHDRLLTTSGSGAFIDDQGVILTNAHVAQFLLLAESATSSKSTCVIREGSPATRKYEAALLYMSPTWVVQNATQLHDEHPMGTGERDFALLYVTHAVDGNTPSTFPSLTIAPESYPFELAPVSAAGYPAYVQENDPYLSLSQLIATTSISRLYTFTDGHVDVIAIAPSAVGEQGSSGGPILDLDDTVIGLITTRGNVDTEGAQSLHALTLPYISRVLRSETGLSLTETLSGDIALRAQIFRETLIPPLRTYLEAETR